MPACIGFAWGRLLPLPSAVKLLYVLTLTPSVLLLAPVLVHFSITLSATTHHALRPALQIYLDTPGARTSTVHVLPYGNANPSFFFGLSQTDTACVQHANVRAMCQFKVTRLFSSAAVFVANRKYDNKHCWCRPQRELQQYHTVV